MGMLPKTLICDENLLDKDLFGKTYRDLPLPENAVLGAIVRNGSIFTPSKNINVEMDDHIIVFINGKTDKDQIEALFSNQIN